MKYDSIAEPTLFMFSKEYNGFISYSRKDGVDFANYLRQKLAEDTDGKQFKLWKDREQMEGDIDWWQQIAEGCDKSEYMIIVLTPESLKSGICQKEWLYARQHGICVRPVKGVAENKIDYKLLPPGMRDAHVYDIDQEWRKFVNDLNRTCVTNRLLFMAPPIPLDYVERKEILDFAKIQLLAKNEKQVALKGAGGFGKTTLAIAICNDEDIKERYHNGVLWATIGEDGNLQREITKIYYALTGDNTKAFIDEEEAVQALSGKVQEGKYLIVLDDVWNYYDVSRLTEKIYNVKETAVLITTRIDSVVQQSRSKECEVNEMSYEQAEELFTFGWDVQAEHQNLIHEILDSLSGWLLLIKLVKSAAEMLRKKGQSLSETLNDIREIYGTEGLTAFDIRDARSRNEAVTRSVEASFRSVQTEEKRKCLSLGIFPTDIEIPVEVIYSLWKMNALAGKRLLQLLANYSLLNLNLDKKVITCHDVFLHYYREKLGEERINEHKKLIDAWNNVYDLPSDYAWNYYVWHLKEIGEISRASELLQDFEWIEAKLFATDINELLRDYGHFNLNSDVKLIEKALKLSSYILAEDKNQISAQIIGRLGYFDSTQIAALVGSANNWREVKWLRPIKASLTKPGALLNIIKAHTDSVTVLITEQEKIVSGSADCTIRVFDIQTGQQILPVLMGHTGMITSIAVYNKEKIISGSEDKTIRIWNFKTGESLFPVLEGHAGRITAVVIYETKIISASADTTIRIWDIETHQIVRILEGHKFEVKILFISKDTLFSGDSFGYIKIWDLKNLKLEPETIAAHESMITKILVPEGTDAIISSSMDYTIRIWNRKTLQPRIGPLKTFEDGQSIFGFFSDCAYYQNKIISVDHNGTFKFWDWQTGEVIDRLIGNSMFFGKTKMSLYNNILVSGSQNGALAVWDINTRQPVTEPMEGHTGRINSIVVSGNKIVSGSSDATIRLWEIVPRQSEAAKSSQANRKSIVGLMLHGDKVISVFSEDLPSVWDINTGDFLMNLKKTGDKTVVQHEDGRKESYDRGVYSITGMTAVPGKLSCYSKFSALYVWDLDTGSSYSFDGHKDSINSVVFHQNEIISCSNDGTIRIWKLGKKKPVKTLRGPKTAVKTIAVTDQIIVSGSSDKLIRIWNRVSGKQVHELQEHKSWITAVTIHDNKIISSSLDGKICLWDLSTYRLMGKMENQSGTIDLFVVSGQNIISTGDDNSIQIWNVDSNQLVKEIKIHKDRVTGIMVHNDKIISSSHDGSIRIWDMKNDYHEMASMVVDAGITCFAVNNTTIVAGDKIGKLHILKPEGFLL